ncbi:YbaB/EbfC family nucleoid-associated protein [Lentzea sp. NPDC005914]|uniref:YbaB/EbfC family nucleoid-associated protein n=1 Tax=Lentzea sp. NPDC005914 TaxID=3154572 RepID=UPI0033D3085F
MPEPQWDTLFNGDPAQVERGVDEWVEGLRQRADRLQRLKTQVDRIQVTETSPNGAVTVTVDATGKPIDVRFGDRVGSVPPRELGPLVMGCIRTAQSRIAQQVREATTAAVGDDLPETRQMVVDSYREKFGDAPPPERPRRGPDDDFGDESYVRPGW